MCVMSYSSLSPLSQAQASTVSYVVPRAESVLLVAGCEAADVELGALRGSADGHHRMVIETGGSLLLATGERPLMLQGRNLQVLPLPDSATRLLAFHDHAKGLQRTLEGDRRSAALLPVRGALDPPHAPQHWLLGELLGDTPAFQAIAARWARREVYQLVRFVLENPDHGVQKLADRYGLSVAQFRRIGRRAFGRSLKEQLRLLRAGRVLHRYADTGHTFTRLSSDFGFSSPSHFCSEIKSLLGRSPSSIYQSVHSL
jgi:AraC-like DNA-binding protein